MADPATQFQSAGLTSPVYTPVETKLPAQQFFTPISPWSGVADAIKNATNTIMNSPLNPQVRAQMQLSQLYAGAVQKGHEDYLAGRQSYDPAWGLGMSGGQVSGQPVIGASAGTLGALTQNQQPQTNAPAAPGGGNTSNAATTDNSGNTSNTTVAGQMDLNQLGNFYRNQESQAAGKGTVKDPIVSIQQNPKDGNLNIVRKSGKTDPLSYQDGWNTWQKWGGKLPTQSNATTTNNANPPTQTTQSTQPTQPYPNAQDDYNSGKINQDEYMRQVQENQKAVRQFYHPAATTDNTPPAAGTVPANVAQNDQGTQLTDANGQPISSIVSNANMPATQLSASTQQGPITPLQQQPTVTHPVMSSQAALAYAKTFDTDASRAVYHAQGPTGEPGFTIFNKKGGSSFVPVSAIAKNNPALVLGDNMGHYVASGQDTGQQPQAPQQPQQPGGQLTDENGQPISSIVSNQNMPLSQLSARTGTGAVPLLSANPALVANPPPAPGGQRGMNVNISRAPVQQNPVSQLQWDPVLGRYPSQDAKMMDMQRIFEGLSIPMSTLQRMSDKELHDLSQRYTAANMKPWEPGTSEQLSTYSAGAKAWEQLNDNVAHIKSTGGNMDMTTQAALIRSVMNGIGMQETTDNLKTYLPAIRTALNSAGLGFLIADKTPNFTDAQWDQGGLIDKQRSAVETYERQLLESRGFSQSQIDARLYKDLGYKLMHLGVNLGGVSTSFDVPVWFGTDRYEDGAKAWRSDYESKVAQMSERYQYVPNQNQKDISGYQEHGRPYDGNAEYEARKDGYTPHEPDPSGTGPNIVNPPTAQQQRTTQPPVQAQQPVQQPQQPTQVQQPVQQPQPQVRQPVPQRQAPPAPAPVPQQPFGTQNYRQPENYYAYGQPGVNDMGPSGRPLFQPRQQPVQQQPQPQGQVTVGPLKQTNVPTKGATKKGGAPQFNTGQVAGAESYGQSLGGVHPAAAAPPGAENVGPGANLTNQQQQIEAERQRLETRGFTPSPQDMLNQQQQWQQQQDAARRAYNMAPPPGTMGPTSQNAPVGHNNDVSHIANDNDLRAVIASVAPGTHLTLNGKVAIKGNDGYMHQIA